MYQLLKIHLHVLGILRIICCLELHKQRACYHIFVTIVILEIFSSKIILRSTCIDCIDYQCKSKKNEQRVNWNQTIYVKESKIMGCHTIDVTTCMYTHLPHTVAMSQKSQTSFVSLPYQ